MGFPSWETLVRFPSPGYRGKESGDGGGDDTEGHGKSDFSKIGTSWFVLQKRGYIVIAKGGDLGLHAL